MFPLLLFFVGMTPIDLVDAYINSVKAFDTVELKMTYSEVLDSPTRLRGVVTREGSYIVRHDAPRWKVMHKGVTRFFNDKDELTTQPESSEFVINEHLSNFQVHQDARGKLQFITASLKQIPDEESIGTTDYFMLLLGFIPGNGKQSFINVLRDSKLEAKEDVLDGRPMWILDSRGPTGHAVMWFDPAAKMQLCRLTLTKSGDDLINGKKVSAIPATPPSDYYPGGKITGFETVLDVRQFGKASGDSYPEDVNVTTSTSYEGGQKATVRYTMHLEGFRKRGLSDADFMVTSQIPNGFVVQVDDDPRIEYEWRDNRIGKSINALAQENLKRGRFSSTISMLGYFVAFAILLAAVLYGGAWAYRHRRTA